MGWHGLVFRLQAVGLEMLDSVRTRKMNMEAMGENGNWEQALWGHTMA